MGNLEEILQKKRKFVDKKATDLRKERDGLNAEMKPYAEARNQLNLEVRSLIGNRNEQRDIREEKNQSVREMKKLRSECNTKVKDAKITLDKIRKSLGGTNTNQNDRNSRNRYDKPPNIGQLKRELARIEKDFEQGKYLGKKEKKAMNKMKDIKRQIDNMNSVEDDNDDMRDARKTLNAAVSEQDDAHRAVTKAAEDAQTAHDLMLEWNKEVDSKREEAEEAHKKFRKYKLEADQAHHHYIVALRCLHSVQEILQAMRGEAPSSKPEARLKVQDLMSKLMSGETLSTEELMELQKHD